LILKSVIAAVSELNGYIAALKTDLEEIRRMMRLQPNSELIESLTQWAKRFRYLVDAIASVFDFALALTGDRPKFLVRKRRAFVQTQTALRTISRITELSRMCADFVGETDIVSLQNSLEVMDTELRGLIGLDIKPECRPDFARPLFVYSLYRQGNMISILWLMSDQRNKQISLVSPYYDFMHVKLLETLSKEKQEMRLVLDPSAIKLFQTFYSNIENDVRFAPSIHSRASCISDEIVISSADMRSEALGSHLEAGVVLGPNHQQEIKNFFNAVWERSTPAKYYHLGIMDAEYKTFCIALANRSFLLFNRANRLRLQKEIQSSFWSFLDDRGQIGFMDSDVHRKFFFFNLRLSSSDPSVLASAIANRLVDEEFQHYLAIAPLHVVGISTERISLLSEMLGQSSDKTRIFYVCDGKRTEVESRSKLVSNAFRLDPGISSRIDSIRTIRIDGKSHQNIIAEDFLPTEYPTFLVVFDLRGKVGLTPLLKNIEVQNFNLGSLFEDCLITEK